MAVTGLIEISRLIICLELSLQLKAEGMQNDRGFIVMIANLLRRITQHIKYNKRKRLKAAFMKKIFIITCSSPLSLCFTGDIKKTRVQF